MRHIADAYRKIFAAAGLVGSQIEAENGFAPVGEGPLIRMVSGVLAGEFAEVCKGENNTVWRSHGSEVVRSRLEISGSNNVVYLGGHSRMRGSDIRLKGTVACSTSGRCRPRGRCCASPKRER